MPVIVSLAIPAGTHNYSDRRLDVHRRRRNVDRLGCIYDTGDANIYANIDVCEGDGGYADAEAGNQRHREPATA
jgi:hypothetical protein